MHPKYVCGFHHKCFVPLGNTVPGELLGNYIMRVLCAQMCIHWTNELVPHESHVYIRAIKSPLAYMQILGTFDVVLSSLLACSWHSDHLPYYIITTEPQA